MSMKTKFSVRQSPKNKQFYTRVSRGKVTFDGGQGHPKKATAMAAITNLIDSIKAGAYIIVDDSEQKGVTPAKSASKGKPAPKEKKKPAKVPAKGKVTIKKVAAPAAAATLQ